MSGYRQARRARRFVRATSAALVALGVSPTFAAAAPAVTVPGACYVYWPTRGSQPIPISISGLTPGTVVNIELQVAGTTVSGLPSVTVDASGAIDTQLRNWTSGLSDGPSKATSAKVVVSDLLLGTEITEAPLNVANVGLDVDAARKATGTKRRWVVSGLERLGGGSIYYAFYFKDDKVIGRQRLGQATGACGYVTAMQPAVPFRQRGTFAFRVQASPSYHADRPWIGGTVRQGKAG